MQFTTLTHLSQALWKNTVAIMSHSTDEMRTEGRQTKETEARSKKRKKKRASVPFQHHDPLIIQITSAFSWRAPTVLG